MVESFVKKNVLSRARIVQSFLSYAVTHVDQNGLAAMLAAKKSASVTPVMNLRILLCI